MKFENLRKMEERAESDEELMGRGAKRDATGRLEVTAEQLEGARSNMKEELYEDAKIRLSQEMEENYNYMIKCMKELWEIAKQRDDEDLKLKLKELGSAVQGAQFLEKASIELEK